MLAVFLDVKNEFVRIQQECKSLERKIELYGKERNEEIKDSHVSAMAAITHGIYSGIESILKDILKYLDGHLPTGSDWQSKLLVRAQNPNPGTREAIIHEKTARSLNDLKGFRHIFRGAYQSSLRPEMVLSMARQTLKVIPTVIREVDVFMEAFEKQLPARELTDHSGGPEH